MRRKRETRGRLIASASFALLGRDADAGAGVGFCCVGETGDVVVMLGACIVALDDEGVGVRDVAVNSLRTSLSVLCQTTCITSAYIVFCAMSAARMVIKGAFDGMDSFTRVEVEKTLSRSVEKRVAQT